MILKEKLVLLHTIYIYIYNNQQTQFQMQVGMFKKSKAGWLQELLAGLANSPILCRPIENTQRVWKSDIVRFQSKGQERIIHPPDLSFRIDGKLVIKLREKLERTRRPVQGVLSTDSLQSPLGTFIQLRSAEEEDVGGLQQSEGVFCVGVVLSRGQGEAQLQRRVKEQLRRCSQRSGIVYSHNSNNSSISDLSRATIRQFRIFLLFDEGRDSLSVGRLLYLPRANIPLRKVKISQPSAFTFNQVYNHIKSSLNFAKEVIFGYISLNPGKGGDKHKFILLDRNDPELLGNGPAVLGVWVAGNLGSGQVRDVNIWSAIMQYLTDPHLTKRFSVSGERTGLFIALDNPSIRDNITPYVFQFPNNARWSITTRVQNISKIPQEYAFCQQEVIMEEEKEESEVESISSKQDRGKAIFEQNSNNSNDVSAYTRTIQEKDAEIKRLKVELQFYKSQCQKMQQALNNMNVLQLAQTTLSNNLPIYSPSSYRQSQSPVADDSLGSDGPFFGKRSEYQPEPNPSKVKEFTVRDMKNISFAQESSFDEDMVGGNVLDKHMEFKINTPEFKELREVKSIPSKDIRAFNFKKNEEAREDTVRNKPKQQNKEKEQEREKVIVMEAEKEKPAWSDKEKPISSTIRTYEQKYDNYKSFAKNINSSPKGKEPPQEQEIRRPPQSEKTTPRRDQLHLQRKTTFEEQPRDRRIKNQLYSQQKQVPKKQNIPTANFPPLQRAKNTSDAKSPEKKNSRSKSPIPQKQPQKYIKVIQSDDQEDAELKTILQKRKKK